MKKNLLLIFALTAIFSQNIFASNFMLIMGGGGEQAGNKTIFDEGMESLSGSLSVRNWKYDILYDGGHLESEKMLSQNFTQATSKKEFTTDNFFIQLRNYKDKILTGEIRSGDQLVIIISSHSAPHASYQKSHSVAAKGSTVSINGFKTYNWKVADLDNLQELISAAKAKNINIGLVDLGCYSGSTLALRDTNTCIISSTGNTIYSNHNSDSFPNQFLLEIRNGQSMEDTFLRTRLNSKDASYPMISTVEGNKIGQQIYNLIAPYENYNLEHYPRLGQNLSKIITTEGALCARENQFKDLIKEINKFEKKFTLNFFSQLKTQLYAYKENQDNILRQAQVKIPILDNVITIQASTDKKQIKLTWGEILKIDTNILIAALSKSTKRDDLILIDIYKKIQIKQNEILKNPEIINYNNRKDKLLNEVGKSYQLAKNIMLEERKLFNNVYDKKESEKTNDPCSKIIF